MFVFYRQRRIEYWNLIVICVTVSLCLCECKPMFV